MRRTSTIRLLPDKETERKLFELGDLCAKAWNEVNFLRRRQFFNKQGVDFRGTYKLIYEKYKREIGSATVQQILNKNNEAWRSFFSLLKQKKEGKLPSYIKPNPPGYWKDYERGVRRIIIVLRKDQYRFENGKVIITGLGKFGRLEIPYRGRIHIIGEKGRAEIIYDWCTKRWYMHISFEVKKKYIRDELVDVPRRPLGSLKAGIDLGINNLFAMYISSGISFLVNGRPLKAEAFYWRKRIAEYQSTLNKYGLKTSRRLKRMWRKFMKRIEHYVRTWIRRVVELLWQLGVDTIFVGYPKDIARDRPESNSDYVARINFLVVNMWGYWKIIRWLTDVAEEYGISVIPVEEDYTSITCPLCGQVHYRGRISRGLFKCPVYNKVMNADIVGAYNILIRGLQKLITPSLGVSKPRGRGNRSKTGPRGEPVWGCTPNLPALATPRTLAL